MDPNANLLRQRAIVREVRHHQDHPTDAGEGVLASLAMELAEHVEALDEWITKGGALPAAWRR